MGITEFPARPTHHGVLEFTLNSVADDYRPMRDIMAAETDEGIAYLRALKGPADSHAATAVAPALESHAAVPAGPKISATSLTADERHQGAEKRRSQRLKCEGSVEIQEDGLDVRTWATFTDISLHGCYVEAQATYPAKTNLHLKLEANGVRVECKAACVRVSYPYLGMGIAFVDMSPENRAHLKELLGTISRPAAIMGPGFISNLPASSPPDQAIAVPHPEAAVQSLLAYFENRHMLMRDDFMKILANSQLPPAKG
jgi:hypothetical protein